MSRRPQSLRERVFNRFAVILASLLVLVTGLLATTLHATLKSEMEKSLVNLASQKIHEVEGQLSFFNEKVATFAASSRLTNSIVDATGYKSYLPRLLNEFASDRVITNCALYDHDGRPILVSYASQVDPETRSVVKRTLSTNASLFHLYPEEDLLKLVYPVRLYGTAQGAFMADIHLGTLVRRALYVGDEVKVRIKLNGQLVHELQRAEFDEFTVTIAPTSSTPIAKQLGLSLDLSVPVSSIQEPILRSVSSLVSIGALILILGSLLARRLATSITEPISRLSEEVQLSRTAQVSLPDTEDEIDHLARAFNDRTLALVRSQEELEARVEERTRELKDSYEALQAENLRRIEVEREARKAKEEAEASSRAKSEFLANMSHEIRTPMTAIIGYSELLTDPKIAEEEGQEIALFIHKNGEHLLTIINDILDLSKVESGKLELELIPSQVRELVHEVYQTLQPVAHNKGLSMTLHLADQVPRELILDPTRVRQIFLNLVNNAIKFTSEGSVDVRVDLEGDKLRFEVEDTGIGIHEDEQDRLFKPFSQADNSTTRKYGGTGLGLYISNCLAELMDGTITLKSQIGAGSTFTVELPVRSPDEAKSQSETQVPKRKPKVDLSGYRVLVVEDGVDNQHLLNLILNRAGAEVVIRENGLEGLDEAWRAVEEDEPYHIILMDMQMPVMSGYEATGNLRQRGFEGPILAITANARAEDLARSIEAGCNTHTTKPFNRTKLLQLIQELLRESETASSR